MRIYHKCSKYLNQNTCNQNATFLQHVCTVRYETHSEWLCCVYLFIHAHRNFNPQFSRFQEILFWGSLPNSSLKWNFWPTLDTMNAILQEDILHFRYSLLNNKAKISQTKYLAFSAVSHFMCISFKQHSVFNKTKHLTHAMH